MLLWMAWGDPYRFAPVFSDHQTPCEVSMIDQYLKPTTPQENFFILNSFLWFNFNGILFQYMGTSKQASWAYRNHATLQDWSFGVSDSHLTLISSALLWGSIPDTPNIIFSAETSIWIGTSNPAKATSRLHCRRKSFLKKKLLVHYWKCVTSDEGWPKSEKFWGDRIDLRVPFSLYT